MNETIVVKYTTEKKYCSCCQQKLPKPMTKDSNHFEFSIASAFTWTNWNTYAEYPEDLESLIPQYVKDTIRFYAVSSNESVHVEESEIEKVREWITSHMVVQTGTVSE